MKLIEQFKQSASYQSLSENRRLQWMLVAIVAILCLSVAKSAVDSTSEPMGETRNQLALLAKLKASENQTIDPLQQSEIQQQLDEVLNLIPQATSISTAEAKTLADIESIIGQNLNNQRLNLLGTEEISAGNEIFWSVRVDVAGRVKEKELLSVLEHFDGDVSNGRLASFRFSPKTSDSINMVVDMLYRKQK